MDILALDTATSTGWAHSNGESGVINLKPGRGESPGMRFVRLRAFLDKKYEESPFEVVAYERAHHRGGHATEVCVGLVTTVQEWAAVHGVDVMVQTASDIKKHAVKKGRASKLAMMLAAERKWGKEPESDDEADALWLLDLVKKELGLC